ncbi:MAG: hypothetical protein RBS68_08305 [Anaerolineales bacterium]|jgi:hypothetical protein|nr:hypothetical protein [Anaerolineales bacterium]
MNQIGPKISRLILGVRFPEWSIPLALLGALGLAFGLLIPRLGVYQDDWLFFYNHYALGSEGINEFMYYDGTPFAAYLNNALFLLLGHAPLNWHLAALLSRWLTVVSFWLVLRRLWPAHPRQTFLSALIFGLHPFFNLQPLAVTFTHVWVSYFLLGLSFYWMILAAQKPERYWLYTLLSLLAGAGNILSGEYFAGLEFLRPILLWFALAGRNLAPKERLLLALRSWLPYLLAFGVYLYWRFFIFELPLEKRNSPVLVAALLKNPLAGLGLILINLIPDTVLIVLSSWYKLLEPGWLDLTVRINQGALLLALCAGGWTFYYLNQQKFNVAQTGPRVNWPLQALFLGISIVVLGLIPPYVGGLFLNAKNPLWNSRFGMASLLGASLIVVALLELLVTSSKARTILLAALVGLSAGWHLRYTNDFRRAWEKQVNFYQQLAVRVPALAPNTAFVAEGEILPLMGDYPTAYAINTLYARQAAAEPGRMPVWFYGITTNFSRDYEEFLQGMTLYTRHRSMVFKGNSHEILLFNFEPEKGECLHVIRPQDSGARTLPDRLRAVSSLSALERIQAGSGFSTFLSEELGVQPAPGWCNLYQRADLARQSGDWEQVIRLWKEARQAGLEPNDNFEYLPFLEAYLYTGQPEQALKLSALAAKAPPSMQPTVCEVWQRAFRETPASVEMQAAFQQVKKNLSCSEN